MGAPGVLIQGIPPDGAGVSTPLSLPEVLTSSSLGGQPVDRDVLLVEPRFITPDAIGIDAQVSDDLLKTAPVNGIPVHVHQLFPADPSCVGGLLVVEIGDSVPVLRDSVAFAVSPLPEFG